jgi:polysaccharide export outer membrane protein
MRMSPLASLLCLALAAAGCAGNKSGPPEQNEGKSQALNAWISKHDSGLPPTVYRVEPPDKLKVVAPAVKEIDGQTSVVRSDGVIALNLVGEIQVSGLSPAEISELIARKLKDYYQKDALDISVQVIEYKSKHVFVLGQVVQPGVKPYTGNNTVLNTLADARLNDLAWPQKVVIVRASEDPNIKQRVTVDLKLMYETGDVKQDFLLEEGDVVYVPPSPLAQIGLEFRHLVYPLIPASNLALMAAGL